MRLNRSVRRDPIYTHEGARAVHIPAKDQLLRSVMACMLWEDTFYESGVAIADRIADLVTQVKPEDVAEIASKARRVMHLRHVPLLLASGLAARDLKAPGVIGDTIADVIQRPDELTEFLAIYWRNGRRPLDAQVKRGLANAIRKFDGYQLAKYDRDGAIKLRDVLRLVHPKPLTEAQGKLWGSLVKGTLKPADTWEVGLSQAGQTAKTPEEKSAAKKAVFERQLREGKLGYLALLRNLRNMENAGVDRDLIVAAIAAGKGAHRVLPFRFVAAARAAPHFESAIDAALVGKVVNMPRFPGRTAILVDLSGSMEARLSSRSDLTRKDAACALAAVFPGEEVHVFPFGSFVTEVPHRIGMAGIDAIQNSGMGGGTNIDGAVSYALHRRVKYDRIVLITDEQSHTQPDFDMASRVYVINVGSYQNGIGYGNHVTHIDGFSENVLRYMAEVERVATIDVDEVDDGE